MIEFHGYFRSSSAYRCRIAFNLKGVEYAFTSVHLRRGGGEQNASAYAAMNPQKLVPTMRQAGLTLTQSMAIIEWLDETYPQPPLLPGDVDLRARVRAFAQIIACDVHPLQNLRVQQYLGDVFGADQEAKDIWCQRWISDGLQACEAILENRAHNGDFCFGNTPGLADICLVPQVFSASRFGVGLAGMPNIRRIYDACQALPAFKDAAPSRQSDAEA